MKYIVEFWNPWAGEWQRWNMEPTSLEEAARMMWERHWFDPSITRHAVEYED